MPSYESYERGTLYNTGPAERGLVATRGIVKTSRIIEHAQSLPTPKEQVEALFEAWGTILTLFKKGGVVSLKGDVYIGVAEVKSPDSRVKHLIIEEDSLINLAYFVNRSSGLTLNYILDSSGNRIPIYDEVRALTRYTKNVYKLHGVAGENVISPATAVSQVLIEAADIWGKGELHNVRGL